MIWFPNSRNFQNREVSGVFVKLLEGIDRSGYHGFELDFTLWITVIQEN